MKHIVIGFGEVGQAIQSVFGCCPFVDINHKSKTVESEWVHNKVEGIMHVCIPFSDYFNATVIGYQLTFKPAYTVIHSTVPVGTCRPLNAIHSPIRGLHPNLYEGVKTFVKFLGGEEASKVADEFRRHGLKIMLFDKQETTELGKLLDTEYYRACIEFALRSKELCNKHGVPYSEAYTLFNMTYNEGYTKLNHPEYVRPVLEAIMKPISGHCVMPNKELLEKSNDNG